MTKLKVQVLPCVIAFVGGQGVDRIVGFEGLGYGGDKFTTSDLERRLIQCGALVREKMTEGESGSKRAAAKEEEEYDSDDWD